MAQTKTLERIYNLKVLGGDSAVKIVDNLSKHITSLDNKVKQLKSVGSAVADNINKGLSDSVKNTGATTTAIGLQKTMTKEIANQRIERERLNKEIKLQAQLDASERNSLQRAQLLINKYTLEKKKLNLATEEGRRLNESYNKAIEKANNFILKNADAETLRTKNIGNYKVVVQGLTPEIEKAVTAFERANQRATQLEQTLGKTHPAAKAARAEFEGMIRPLENAGVQIEKVAFQSTRAAQAQFSMQQVLRETPSLANGVNVYFSAISNNLPILADNFKALRTELGSGRAAFNTILKSVFSFQTGLLLGLTILTVYGKDIANWVSGLFKGSKALDDIAIKQKLFNEVQEKAKEGASSQLATLEQLYKTATNANIPLKARKEAVDELQKTFPAYFKNLKDEIILNGQAEQSYNKLRTAILLSARSEAIKDSLKELFKKNPTLQLFNKEEADKQNKEMAEAQKQHFESRKKFNKEMADLQRGDLRDQTGVTAQLNRPLNLTPIVETEEQKKLKALLELSATTETELSKLGGRADAEIKATTDKKTKSKIEALKAEYEKERKMLETLLSDKLISEKEFNENALTLDKNYRDKKLLLTVQKNKEEEEKRIGFNKDLAKSTSEANDRLFEIEKVAAERRLNIAIATAERIKNAIDDDPKATNLQRIQAEIDLLNKRKDIQVAYNTEMDALEKKFGKKSEENEQARADAIYDIDRELRRKRYEQAVETYNEQLRLQQEAADKFRNDAETRAAQRTIDVLNSELTARQKAIEIKKIQLAETKEILAGEVAAAKIALEAKEKALKDGLATEIEVSEAKKRLKQAELAYTQFAANQELSYLQKLKQGFKDILNNLTGFFKGIKASQEEIGSAIAAATESIKQAISEAKQAFFDNKRQEVDDAKQAALERLDIEQAQLESFAQSEAEKESIRRQFEAKRKEAEKQAGEEKKKIALQQLTLDSAVAVVKTLAAYPFPFSLIPVAGLGILYAIQRSIVKNTKFARGGMPRNGGDIVGPSHAEGGVPFNYEAEGEELAIVNKRSAKSNQKLSVTGTPRQIASAINEWGGGVRFASGAAIRKLEYGGNLGSNLRPPVNPSSFLSPGNSNSGTDAMNNVLAMVATVAGSVAATNDRIDKLKVVVVAKEVDAQNTKDKKAAEIGTL